jgi:hypothetical protein
MVALGVISSGWKKVGMGHEGSGDRAYRNLLKGQAEQETL